MKRARLTKSERAEMLERQAGVCWMPGCCNKGPFIEEHYLPYALSGVPKPDCLLCVPCAFKKTTGPRGDLNVIAHIKRIAEKRTQADKRKARGYSLIQGRGFDQSLRKRFDGTVEPRE